MNLKKKLVINIFTHKFYHDIVKVQNRNFGAYFFQQNLLIKIFINNKHYKLSINFSDESIIDIYFNR